jgi:hypothetical protein
MGAPVRSVLHLLGVSALILLIAAALNFIVDPLQLFRPAGFYAPMYSADTRMQNAGLIRSQDFDTVLIGTSLAIHFRQSDIDRILGGRSLKLSMTGSNSREQGFAMGAALARHPKRVIWEIDDWIFHDAPEIDADIYFPPNLYRRNAIGVAGYLLSGAMVRESLWLLARSAEPLAKLAANSAPGWQPKFSIAGVDDINVLPPGFDVSALYNAKKAMASFSTITDPQHRSYLADGADHDAMVRNFERDAVGLIAAHPDVQFDIYFPPYSILQWVAMRDASPATLQIVYDFTAYASRRLTELPNVVLRDFRDVGDVTHGLNNYSDVIHHSPAVDLQVLSWLADGKYQVDPAAPTASLDRLKAQVESYKVDGGR